MINPAEAILEWINLVNMDHQDKICRFVLARVPHEDWQPGQNDEVHVFHDLLEYDESQVVLIGKLLAVRSTIDFMMEERGSDSWWNSKIDMYLDVINDEEEEVRTKEDAQKKLGQILRDKHAWLETASSWKKLVRNVLSNKVLREWRRGHILKESL